MLGFAPLLHKFGFKDIYPLQSAEFTAALLGCTRTKSSVPLDPYESILTTHPSIHNSYTCLYIHTSMHLFICSSISRVHLRHHVSRPCIYIYLSTFRSIHPQQSKQAFTCHSSINPSIYPSGHIASFPHTSVWMPAGVQSSLALHL